MIDPKSAARGSDIDYNINSVRPRKKAHPWAWMIGLAAALLLIWGFFGMDHLKTDVEPAASPAATSIAE